MFRTRVRRNVRVFLISGMISLFTVGIIFAQVAPQKMGFRDVKFADLNKDACAECHGSSAVAIHHETDHATSGNCVLCHSVVTQAGSTGVSLQRDCMACHEDGPHHSDEVIEAKECTTCHDTPGLNDYSTEVPAYEPSGITPKPSDCRICHDEGMVDGQNVLNPKGTHHQISTCSLCHDQLILDEEERDKGVTIRACERCHNVKVLHEVEPHVEDQSCAACHGGKTVAAQPAVEEETAEEAEEIMDQ